MKAELRMYIDENYVTFFVNPAYIQMVALNRVSFTSDWRATITLIDGSQFVLSDASDERLIHRIKAGDA